MTATGAGPVSKRHAVQEIGSQGCCDKLLSEDTAGARNQTSGRIDEVGTHDSDSGRIGKGERAIARADDVAALAAGAAPKASIFAFAVAVKTVACLGGSAHDTAITASRGACITAMLVTAAGARIEGARDCATVAAAVSILVSARAGFSQASSLALCKSSAY